MEAEAAAAAAQADGREGNRDDEEPDTSDLEDTIAALEEQIEELEEDAEAEADAGRACWACRLASRIISLCSTAPSPRGRRLTWPRCADRAIMSAVEGPRRPARGTPLPISFRMPIIPNSGLFYDFNGDGVLNNNADQVRPIRADDLLGTTGRHRRFTPPATERAVYD